MRSVTVSKPRWLEFREGEIEETLRQARNATDQARGMRKGAQETLKRLSVVRKRLQPQVKRLLPSRSGPLTLNLTAPKASPEMQRLVQQNLVAFLEIEIDIAGVFLKMAKTVENHERRTRLLRSAQEAIDTIHRFEAQVANRRERRQLVSRATELKQVQRREWP